jgi:uncharacterized protein (TIGR04141 family)
MKLTLYMLRSDLDAHATGLRESFENYEFVPTRPLEGMTCELYVRHPPASRPRWLADLESIVEGDALSKLRNQLSSALLLVARDGRRFVLSYGGGHHTVDRECIEQGFGLRVTVNVVAANRVVSAETRGLNQTARSQRTVLPIASAFYELGIDYSEDWIRQLTGKPEVEDFGRTISGSDSLKLDLKGFQLSKLGEQLDRIVEHYLSTGYKRDFNFLDYFTRVRDDKSLFDRLWAEAAARIKSRSDELEFAAPEPLEPMDIHRYVLKHGRKSNDLPEISRDLLYGQLDRWGDIWDPLKAVRIEAMDSSDNPVGDAYRLFDYLIAEVSIKDKRYTLSAGCWFVIDPDYVSQVNARVAEVDDLTSDLNLPTWVAADGDESYYNLKLQADLGWLLLDKKNFPVGGPNQKIEICDLLTPDKKLICVKRLRKSPSLSHLFAQGVVSAQLLVVDGEAHQKAVVQHLRKLDSEAEYGTRGDWTVVYAIATEKPDPLSETMPFFSRVNLDRTVKILRGTGVKVAVARVPLLVSHPARTLR